jgi:hypothetical protein
VVAGRLKHVCRFFWAYECLLGIPGFGLFVSSPTPAGFDLNAKHSGKTSVQAVPVLSKNGQQSDMLCALPGSDAGLI